jgi:hypothetical protein
LQVGINSTIHNQQYLSDKIELGKVLDFYKDKTNFDEFIANNDKKIRSIYDDTSNPIIWLIRFKDMKTLYYKHLKPIRPRIKPIENIYSIFSNHISNIKAHLLKNSDINFYLIKISIPHLINSYLEYRDTIASEWKSRRRIILDDGDPSCY